MREGDEAIHECCKMMMGGGKVRGRMVVKSYINKEGLKWEGN